MEHCNYVGTQIKKNRHPICRDPQLTTHLLLNQEGQTPLHWKAMSVKAEGDLLLNLERGCAALSSLQPLSARGLELLIHDMLL